MAKCIITDMRAQKQTVTVTWSWENHSQTDRYEIRWYYTTHDGITFTGSNRQVTLSSSQLESTFTAPENTALVKFIVRPISKTYTVNGAEMAYWTAEWSTEAVYSFSDEPPKTPPTPNVEIGDYTLKASLSGINLNANRIEFQIVKNDKDVFNVGTATIVDNAASYACNVSAGSKYKVRCRAKRGELYSGWSNYTENFNTPPTIPGLINKCYGTSSTSAYIAWNAVSSAKTYDIEYATKREYFGGHNTTTVIDEIEGTFYNVTGLQTGTKYYFRIRSVNDEGTSAWTDPVCIILGSLPSAPTTWSSTTTAIIGEDVVLHWIHNAEDGSKERIAEVDVRINGVKSTYYVNNPEYESDGVDNNSHLNVQTSQLSSGTIIEWRVRTAGITNEYGDWSVQRQIKVYAPPTMELRVTDLNNNAIDTLMSFPFRINALGGPEEQVVLGYYVTITAGGSYETVDEIGNVKMINEGDEVYTKFHDTSQALTVEITAGDVDLENNIEYKVTCMSTLDSGLSAKSSVSFKVAWMDAEYEPNAEIGYDSNNLSVYIRPYCKDTSGNLIEGITLSVYRREYDGRFVEIGKGLNNMDATFITDPHPSLDYARYRIVARDSMTGAVSYSDIPGYPVGEKAVVIQWDEQWTNFQGSGEESFETPTWAGSVLKLPYNIDISDSSDPDVTLVEYIGRAHPVSYYGTQVGSTSTWKVDIAKSDKNTVYALRRLSVWLGDVYVREPSGSGYWANITVSFDQNHCEMVIPVTLNIVRVEGGI